MPAGDAQPAGPSHSPAPAAQELASSPLSEAGAVSASTEIEKLLTSEPASSSRIWSKKFVIALVAFVVLAFVGSFVFLNWLELS